MKAMMFVSTLVLMLGIGGVIGQTDQGQKVSAGEQPLYDIFNDCILELKLSPELGFTKDQKLALAKKFVIKVMDAMVVNLDDKKREWVEGFTTRLQLPEVGKLTAEQKIRLYQAMSENFGRRIQKVIALNEEVRTDARRQETIR
jgi:hypothetical protein